jgi:hypothetical protein
MYLRLFGSNLLRLLRAALFALLLATAAFAASPAAAAVPGLIPAQGSSNFDSQPFKGANATCPPGKKVIGGGAQIIGGAGKVGLTSLGFNADNTVYSASAQEIGFAGTTANWLVRAYATCVNASAVPDLVQIEGPPSASDSFGHKQAFADCPTGKKLVGLGATVLPVNNGAVALWEIEPRFSSLKGATVGAAEVAGGTTKSWGVRAEVVCVNQNSVIDVELVSRRDDTSGSSVSRTFSCPTGKKVIGGGVLVLGVPFGHVIASRIQPRADSDLRSISIGAQEVAPGTPATWTLVSHALCATP